MRLLVELAINGILMGSIYGLIALGLTLIFGIMKVINFAHGSFLMVGMFATYWMCTLTGLDPYVSLLIVVPFCFCLGYLVQNFLIKPVFKKEIKVREPIGVLLLTSGLWMFMDNTTLAIFGASYRTVKTPYAQVSYQLGDILLSAPQLYAFIGTIIATFCMYVFLRRTSLGKAIRATGQDRNTAELMGVNTYRIYNIAFGVGIALTGLAGGLLTPFFYIYPTVGFSFDIKAFIIVVLGGLGSIPGAILGGIIIGLIESVAAQFMTSTLTIVLAYVVFLLVLLFKPEGLFGFKGEW